MKLLTAVEWFGNEGRYFHPTTARAAEAEARAWVIKKWNKRKGGGEMTIIDRHVEGGEK